MTIEELSRTLQVAAVYLEDKLEKLCSMEYMVQDGHGRYHTNFFLRDTAFEIARCTYQYTRTMPLAEAFYRVAKEALPEIRKSGFSGDITDDMLLWDILLMLMTDEINQSNERMIASMHLEHHAPMRPDGSKHWLRAGVSHDEVIQILIEKAEEKGPVRIKNHDLYRFYETSNGFGLKRNHFTPINISTWQFDMPLISEWRTFSDDDLSKYRRILALNESGDAVNEWDRSIIAAMAEKGIITKSEDHIVCHIPYFNGIQAVKMREILRRHADAVLDRPALDRIFCDYAVEMKQYIPFCVCENERNHYLTSYDPYNAVFYLLTERGYLRLPDKAEQAYICTVILED